jgi:hypothetical protein
LAGLQRQPADGEPPPPGGFPQEVLPLTALRPADRFSRYNFNGYCLGVLFTSRQFDELVLGEANKTRKLVVPDLENLWTFIP